MKPILFLLVFLALELSANAESVNVKYRGMVALDSFNCVSTERSSLVKRVCYDLDKQYMIINLNGTYYHYCEIGSKTVKDLLAASLIGQFYIANIKGSGFDGPFDCRTHRVPNY